MEKLGKRIEIAANLSIVVVAVLIAIVLVRNYVVPRAVGSPPNLPRISVGENLPLTDVDWAGNGRTLVLALSTQCHFCTESGPFYKRVVQKISANKQIHIIAVFPQPKSEGAEYLAHLGIPVTDVRTAPLNSIKVIGTPTVLLVNEKGLVTEAWTGKLPANKENEILAKL